MDATTVPLARVLASDLEGASADPEEEALRAGERWGAYPVDRPRRACLSRLEVVEPR